MKVYDLKDENDRIFAFEVENFFLGRRSLCKLVSTIPGVKILRKQKFFSGEEVFCEFEIQGQKFTAWEPFGDNSRYWIGAEPPEWCEQFEIVRNTFLEHKFFS